jgi:putative transposase
MPTRPAYPSALSDKEWDVITPLVPEAKPGGRAEDYPKREILNGLFSRVRRGCAWRMLPHALPPWRPVYHYLRTWRRDGPWPLINDVRRGDLRVAEGRVRQPSAGIIARQSVNTTETGGATATTSPKTSRAANATSLSTRSACFWR